MKLNSEGFFRFFRRRSTWLWVLFILSGAMFVSFMSWLAIVSLYNGTHMSTFAADGTFQLYNPLRRLQLGQAIGRDFPFFHGIGIPFLHYPVFMILGQGVFAAEVAKWVVSPLLFVFSSFFFFYAYFRDVKRTTIAAALLTALSLSWVDVIWPGNSLIGARGFFPVLVAGALLWRTSRKIHLGDFTIRANELAALLLLGLSVIFGTEQGVAAVLAYALVRFALIIRRRETPLFKSMVRLASEGVLILSVAFIAFTIFTKGHPISAIHYAFFDIPMDQGWYFGTEITGYLTWGNLLPRLFHVSLRYMWLVTATGVMAAIFLARARKRKFFWLPMGFMFTYGVVAFIITIGGYYSPSSQLIPLERMMSLILVTAFVTFLFGHNSWHQMPPTKPRLVFKIILLSASLALAANAILNVTSAKLKAIRNDFSVGTEIRLAKKARHSDDYFASSAGWKESIDTFRPYIDPSKPIWSMYTSVYDTTFGNQLNPSSGGEDYIIHALGDARRSSYESDFLKMKPYYVITLKPSYFIFEEWLWHNHWAIYKQIFTQYDLVSENSSHYLWRIKSQPQTETTSHTATTTKETVSLPANDTNAPVVYSVNIQYKANSSLPATSRLPRYLIKINARYAAQQYQISLPSQRDAWTFPVLSMPGEGPITLRASTEGIVPLTSLVIEGATYSQTPIGATNMRPLENNLCFMYKKKQVPNDYPWTCNSTTQDLTLKQPKANPTHTLTANEN